MDDDEGYERFQLYFGSENETTNQDKFYTMKFDFKPASCDTERLANLNISTGNHASLSVPMKDNFSLSTFRGLRRKVKKEYLLIVDRETMEARLEKVDENFILKRAREGNFDKSNDSINSTLVSLTNSNERDSTSNRFSESSSDDDHHDYGDSNVQNGGSGTKNKPDSYPTGIPSTVHTDLSEDLFVSGTSSDSC